jgi:hypothetical protein
MQVDAYTVLAVQLFEAFACVVFGTIVYDYDLVSHLEAFTRLKISSILSRHCK